MSEAGDGVEGKIEWRSERKRTPRFLVGISSGEKGELSGSGVVPKRFEKQNAA